MFLCWLNETLDSFHQESPVSFEEKQKHGAYFKLPTMCVFIFRKEKKRLRATAVLVNLSRFTLSHTYFYFASREKKKASCLLPQMSVFRNVRKKKKSCRIKPRMQKKSSQMPAMCYHMLHREAGFGRLRHCIKQCIIYKWIIINEAKEKESRQLQTNQ